MKQAKHYIFIISILVLLFALLPEEAEGFMTCEAAKASGNACCGDCGYTCSGYGCNGISDPYCGGTQTSPRCSCGSQECETGEVCCHTGCKPASEGCPPPCTPCGECPSEGCAGTCADTCGVFKQACSSKTCVYYPASLTATSNNPCVGESDASRTITVTGRSSYCGDISFMLSWAPTTIIRITDRTYEDYTFSRSFVIPKEAIMLLAKENIPLTITVSGNRNEIKNTKDEPTYDCTETITIVPTYDNFLYFPDPQNNYAEFDYYLRQIGEEPSGYYYFYGAEEERRTEYAWDEGTSDRTKKACSPVITDCVDKDGVSYRNSSVFDADTDNEFEVCQARDLIQGGWTDADSEERLCDLVDGNTPRDAEWFDCTGSDEECIYAKDDFAPAVRGLCCGDDSNEKPIISEFTIVGPDGTTSSTSIVTACCSNQHSCVDQHGNCVAVNTEKCVFSGYKAICRGPDWEIIEDAEECVDLCENCDVNDDAQVNINDLNIIESNYFPGAPGITYDEKYDTLRPRDGKVDRLDREYCHNSFFNQICYSCDDGILQATEECSDKGSGDEEFNCEESFCSADKRYVRKDIATPGEGGCFACNCIYTSVCDVSCGSECDPEDTATIPAGFSCEESTCTLKRQLCPPGTTLCQDGSCSADCDASDGGNQGCIDDDDVCDPGEGCACEACQGKQDSCISGAICGTDELCGCAPGTTLCADGLTCSATCNPAGCLPDSPAACLVGEGCGCLECHNEQDSCAFGYVCNYYTGVCEPPCVKTEDPEVTLNDGIDNDCDGLVDEPSFYRGYGVYVWEANCNYYMCVNNDESVLRATSATLNANDEYTIFNVRPYNLEADDSFSLRSDGKRLSFVSRLQNGIDCIIFRSDGLVTYDIDLNGSKSVSRIYLTQRRINPLSNPFTYASPDCTLSCTSPEECGTAYSIPLWPSRLYCDYEECIFSCGGYWIDESYPLSWISGFETANDYCKACQVNMTCSNYTNQPSCVFDPCFGALTPLGCKWNETAKKCTDNIPSCMPGTALCIDGTCSSDCAKTDTAFAGCIGEPNRKCEPGEGCACTDCRGEKDSCVSGAECGRDRLCGCPEGTTLCNDNTCDDTCADNGGKKGCIGESNGACEPGEGCACIDCAGQQDSCTYGNVCNYIGKICVNEWDFDCPAGKTLCEDYTCHETCSGHGGKKGCIDDPNGKCEYGEGCACIDCHNKRDSCARGLVCNYDYKLCEEVTGGSEGGDTCTDSDKDGYYKISTSCSIGDDCNDNSASVHPGAIELCNSIDDNCDGKVDENCVSDIKYGLELTLESTQSMRIFDTFKVKAKVRNNLNEKVSDVFVALESKDSRIVVKKGTGKIQAIEAGGTGEVEFEVMVKGYDKEQAALLLKANLPNTNIVSKEILLDIDVPPFLVAADPDYYEQDGKVCLDIYYALNAGLAKSFDLELDIVNPGSVFGKSVIVDYISGIDAEEGIVIRPLISNPYCIPRGSVYEIRGYLYQSGGWKIVNKAEESLEVIDLS